MHPGVRGAVQALPVVLGYFPVAFAYGILAVKAGFSPLMTGLMSLLVYAGSGQFIAVSLVVAGATPSSIILTTFIVNLRHLLMSASLIPYLRSWPKLMQTLFGFEMTDETFAVNLGSFTQHGVCPVTAYVTNTVSHFSWVAGGVAGAFFGDALGDMKVLGLDYALPAMFIALIIPHIRIPKRLAAVILGFGFSIAFALLGAGQWSVIAATVSAASLAVLLPFKGAAFAPADASLESTEVK